MLGKLFGKKKEEKSCGCGGSCNTSQASDKNLVVVPISGEIIPLEKVPDPVFAEKMMGEGFAIIPENGNIYSPVDGTIVVVQEAKHAIAIESDAGDEIIIHFGIDTVNLGGKGFTTKVKVGDRVKAGDLINVANIAEIEGKVPSIITPVLFTNLGAEDLVITYGKATAKAVGVICKK